MLRTYYKTFLQFKNKWSRFLCCIMFHRAYYYLCGPMEVEDGVTLPGNECWSCTRCGRSWAKIVPAAFPSYRDTVIVGEYVSNGTFTDKENEGARE